MPSEALNSAKTNFLSSAQSNGSFEVEALKPSNIHNSFLKSGLLTQQDIHEQRHKSPSALS